MSDEDPTQHLARLRASIDNLDAALVHLLAEELGVARRDVRIVAGATGRQKLVVVDGVEPEVVVARWPGLRV